MSTRGLHFAVWPLLIWMGLTNALLTCGVVVCRDGRGAPAIEWGCDRTAQGSCAATRTGQPDDDHPRPCQDTPLALEHFGKASLRGHGEVVLPAPLLVPPAVIAWAETPTEAVSSSVSAAPERPPDAVEHVRTVILIV